MFRLAWNELRYQGVVAANNRLLVGPRNRFKQELPSDKPVLEQVEWLSQEWVDS